MSTGIKSKLLEENFFRPRWYSVFLNPYFINRHSLYVAMKHFAKTVPATAEILDVGCGIKPYRSLFTSPHYVGIDITGGGHDDTAKVVDAFYDGHHIPFPDQSFDTLLCTQVLEHADNPTVLVQECIRVLKPGAQAFFSMPFTYPEHEVPYDFRRFTRFEHERLFKQAGFSSVEIQKTTGFFGTVGQLLVVWLFESMTFRAPLLKAVLTVCLFAPIQIAALLLDGITNKAGLTMDYVIYLKK